MTGGDFISLLSSDDEASPALPRLSRPAPYTHAISNPCIARPYFANFATAKDQILHISDDFKNLIDSPDRSVTQTAKRRKLNATTEVQAYALETARRQIIGPATQRLTSKERARGSTDDDDDPIIFTSSAHGGVNITGPVTDGNEQFLQLEDDSDGSFPEDVFLAVSNAERARNPRKPNANNTPSAAPRPAKGLSTLSDKTLALLANLAKDKSSSVLPKDAYTATTNDAEEDGAVPREASKVTRKPRLTEEEKIRRAEEKEREQKAKAKEKERSKEQRAKDKEKGLEQRRVEKERKASQKRIDAEIAEVNKAKLDKKDSTPEMIVDIPASLNGSKVDTQTRAFLTELAVEASIYQSAVPNVVKWRRKVKAKLNVDHDQWEPLPQIQIEDEKHVICIMPALELVSLAQETQGAELHIARLRSAYPDCVPIYLVDGITKWTQANRTAQKRAFEAQVKGQTEQANNRKKIAHKIVDEDLVEDALIQLQISGCFVHYTACDVETAQWIAIFTQHISTIPYRMQRMNLETTFCMESGQVKTGENNADTFVKMLQEVVRVTPQIAYAIVGEYPSLTSLMNAFRTGGQHVLQGLYKSANRDGAVTDQRVGPKISSRLYKIFMEDDPISIDV